MNDLFTGKWDNVVMLSLLQYGQQFIIFKERRKPCTVHTPKTSVTTISHETKREGVGGGKNMLITHRLGWSWQENWLKSQQIGRLRQVTRNYSESWLAILGVTTRHFKISEVSYKLDRANGWDRQGVVCWVLPGCWGRANTVWEVVVTVGWG